MSEDEAIRLCQLVLQLVESVGTIVARLKEVERVQKEVVLSLAERVAKQSNQLSMNAERQTASYDVEENTGMH